MANAHEHISMVKEDTTEAQATMAAMKDMDQIMNEVRSEQENRMCVHGAANQLHSPCTAVAVEGKHCELIALNPEASNASNQQIFKSDRGVEIAELAAAELSPETTETCPKEAPQSLVVVAALASDSSGKPVCKGSNVHMGKDVHMNTETKVSTPDNNAVCMDGQGTVRMRANKRPLEDETARQLHESLTRTKGPHLPVLLHAVTDLNAAPSQVRGEEAPWSWWWKELDLRPQRHIGRPAIGTHVVVQGKDHQAPRRGVVIDVVGKCWCKVALEDDEFGNQQQRAVLEPNHTVRCRTNLVRIISAAEEERINAAAAKLAASASAASDTGFGKNHAAQSLPLEKAMTVQNDNAELCCVDAASSKRNMVHPNEPSCHIQGSEVIYPVHQHTSLSCPEISSESGQSSNIATEQQVSCPNKVSQNIKQCKVNQKPGEIEQSVNHSSHTAVLENQCVEQMTSQQQGGFGASTRRSLLIIPVSDFTPITAEPAISWASFGPDCSGTLPKRMRAPSS